MSERRKGCVCIRGFLGGGSALPPGLFTHIFPLRSLREIGLTTALLVACIEFTMAILSDSWEGSSYSVGRGEYVGPCEEHSRISYMLSCSFELVDLQVLYTQSLKICIIHWTHGKGRRQNSLPLTTNFSQNVTEPSKGISYPFSDLCRRFTKLTGPSVYTLHSNLIPQQMVQMAFCDLSHTFHKQVTNVSSMFLSSYCGEF